VLDPNILIIDGVSNNLGTEGLDQKRIDAVYDYLLELEYEYGDSLQIIVADNTVPRRAADHVRVQLSDEDKLIPAHLLGS
jgi:predicted ABC-type transport system involved in lysophospholipase L1 biosynthesis ATPase subunit